MSFQSVVLGLTCVILLLRTIWRKPRANYNVVLQQIAASSHGFLEAGHGWAWVISPVITMGTPAAESFASMLLGPQLHVLQATMHDA